MEKVLSCPNGHRWGLGAGPLPELGGMVCPECGQAARTVPPADTPSRAVADETCAGLDPSADPAGPADEVPGYQILEPLGEGGMGVVFKARHLSLNRVVALKLVRHAEAAGSAAVARMRAEARAVARLNHPHIVQIFEVGPAGRAPYLAFEYVPGGTLADRLMAGPVSPAEAARLVAPIARAVQAAHDAGVIHRDLKPGNVLLTTDGTPKVADFGLARHLDPEAAGSRTRTGAVMGTPNYMAPEQAAGEVAGPAADVWALGAVLYELLTGHPPFRAANVLDTLDQVRSADPVRPRKRNPTVPRDLETVCLKCLEKDPARRYPSAAAVADDLERFTRGEPVAARPVGRVERAWRKVRRRPWVSGLTAVSAVAVLVAGVLAWQWKRSEAARERAEREAANKPGPELVVAIPTAETGTTAWRYTTATPPDGWADPAFDDSTWETGPAAFGSRGQNSFPVRTAWVSPDLWLRTMWVADSLPDLIPVLRVYHDDDVRVWVNGQPVLERRGATRGYGDHPLGPDERAAFRVGANVIAVHAHNAVGVQGVDVGLEWRKGERPAGPPAADPGSPRAPPAGPPAARLVGHTRKVTGLAWFADGKRAVSCGNDQTIRVWDVSHGQELARFEGRSPLLHHPAVSADGTRMVVGDELGLRVFDPAGGRELAELRGHTKIIHTVALSPDGKRAFSGSEEERVLAVWDVPAGKLLKRMQLHPLHSHAIALSTDGRVGVSGACDTSVKTFDPATLAERQTFPGLTRGVIGVGVSPDGSRVVGVDTSGRAVVWDGATGAVEREYPLAPGAVPVALSADASRALAVTPTGSGTLSNPMTGEILARTALGVRATTVALSPDGSRALVGGEDGTIVVWHAPPGPDPAYQRFVASATSGENGLRAEYFHAPPAGTELSGDPLAVRTEAPESIWPTAARPPGVPANPFAVRWTGRLRGPQPGRYRLTATGNAVRVWIDGQVVIDGPAGRREAEIDLADRPLPLRVEFVRRAGPDVFQLNWRRRGMTESEPISRAALLHDDGGEVRSWIAGDWLRGFALSLDDQFVLTGGDKRVTLWELATGRLVRRFKFNDQQHNAAALAFAPDGSRAVGGGGGQVLHVWRVATGEQTHAFPVQHGISGLAFFPDGRRVAVWCPGQPCRVMDLETGKFLPFKSWAHGGQHVRFFPDGRSVLTGHLVMDAATGETRFPLVGQSAEAWDCAISPDGTLGATAASGSWKEKHFVAHPDTMVQVWDLATGKALHRMAPGEGHFTVAFTTDSRYLLTGAGWVYGDNGKQLPSPHKALRMYDVRTGAEVRTLGEPGSLWNIGVTRDGKYAVTTGADGFVRVWKLPRAAAPPPVPAARRLTGPGGAAYNVVWSPDGSRLLITGWGLGDGIATQQAGVWEVATGRRLAVGVGFSAALYHAAFASDSRCVLVTKADGSLVVWNPEAGVEGPPLGRIQGWKSLAVHGDLAVVSDGKLRLFDLTGEFAPRQLPFDAVQRALAVTPDGKRALACPDPTTLALVDLRAGDVVHRFVGHTKDVHGVAVTADGTRAATAGHDGTVRVWDLSSGKPVHTFDAHPGNGGFAHAVSFSPDGKWLASSGNDGRVVLWDKAAGTKAVEWQFGSAAFCVAFAPDGKTLAVGLGDGAVYLLPVPEK